MSPVRNESVGQQKVPLYIEKQLLAVEMIPVEQLSVDHTYQRVEEPERINKMIREWRWDACGHLAVSLRKGRKDSYYVVIDGQQRLAAIRAQNYSEAPCRIYIDLSQTQEAELYEKLNDNKKPTFNDLFKSRLARKEEVASAINTAVESVGYHLDFDRKRSGGVSGRTISTSHFYIQTMVELERMYNTAGVVHIMDTLKLYKSCFAGEGVGKQAMVLGGMSLFLRNYTEFNRNELIEKMRRVGVVKLIQNAGAWQSIQGRNGGFGKAFCEAMLLTYNYNRQESNRIKSKF